MVVSFHVLLVGVQIAQYFSASVMCGGSQLCILTSSDADDLLHTATVAEPWHIVLESPRLRLLGVESEHH